jgi:glycosyl hydrolase family 123
MKIYQKITIKSLLCLIVIINYTTRVQAITEIQKPQDIVSERKTLTQAPIPTSWKEKAFVEINKVPNFTVQEKKRGFILFKRALSEIVYPNTIPSVKERLSSLKGFACRGQFETLTFSIYPNRELKNLKVRISDFKNGNSIIAQDNINVKLQTYWKIPYPSYATKGTWRQCPELLEKVSVHNSPAKQCQRYWITVKVPQNAKAGFYKGAVTLWDDSYDKAVKIPISFRVMSFDLLSDPNKFFSAYYYDIMWNHNTASKSKEENDFIYRAAVNNYKSMLDHGFNIMPTVYLYYNSSKDEIYARKGDLVMKAAKEAGFKNTKFVPGCFLLHDFIKKYSKESLKGWSKYKNKELDPKVRTKLAKLFADFNKKWLAKGYPQMYCCPIDEIPPSGWKFGTQIFEAVKKSGMKVYITKNPMAPDAHHYEKIVDAFCTQAFTPEYKKVVNSRLEYWCYPNHNAWEVRIPSVMCNGGRMTYGLGFWRSGFKVIIPWAWSCSRGKIPASYIDPKEYAYAGNQTDKNGEVINTTYWECFRAGRDDGRYIYTLQKSIVEHEKNKNKECVKLCRTGRELLQKIWNSIVPEIKYKGPETISIPAEDFMKLRWQMAALIENLGKFKGKKVDSVASVIIDSNQSAVTKNVIQDAIKANNLIIRDLGSEKFELWKTLTQEVTLSTTTEKAYIGSKSLKMTVKIDYLTDGGGEKGKYVIGWPRIYTRFTKNSLDLTKYNYLTFKVYIDSDRNEVEDDYTSAYWTISSHIKGGGVPNQKILGQVPQRKWLTVTLDLNKIIGKNSDTRGLKSINIMQFGINESDFIDKTKIIFYLDDISLISFKNPIIKSIKSTSIVFTPAKKLNCGIQLMGETSAQKGEYKVNLSLIGSNGKCLTNIQCNLSECSNMDLDIKNIACGKYILKAEIINKTAKAVSQMSKEINLIRGPISE